MKSLAIILTCFLLTAGAGFAADETSWASFSDRSDNLLILTYLTADLDTALGIIKSLSIREDPFIGDILDYFFTHISPDAKAPRQAGILKHTTVLTNLLSNFFSSDSEKSELQVRLDSNRKELAEIFGSLPYLENIDLKIEATRLIGLSGEQYFYPLIVCELERIVDIMPARNELFTQPEEKLCIRLMLVVRDCGIQEARPALQSLSCRSRSEMLVKTARTVLSSLVPSP
ncbi:MAG: hypothetical protein EHM28_08130 [Spirochaetaceae bacterium]|nr:MAG: hypothetical protein EHM28_08130 [Spirochaetaceae bacterium]